MRRCWCVRHVRWVWWRLMFWAWWRVGLWVCRAMPANPRPGSMDSVLSGIGAGGAWLSFRCADVWQGRA